MSQSLSVHGEEFLAWQLAATPGLFESMVGLHESFAGIGGALAIWGIQQVWSTASEVDEGAMATLRYHYPDFFLLGDVSVVSIQSFR